MFYKTKYKNFGQRLKAKLIIPLIIYFIVGAFFSFAPAFAQNTMQSYTIKLKQASDLEYLQFLSAKIEHRFILNTLPEFSNLYTFESPSSLAELKKQLAGRFDYLNSNRFFQVQTITVNDPGFTNNFNNVDKQWGLAKTNVLNAWAKTTGSKSVVVAVIDTGIDATHEDLRSINFANGFNYISKQVINGTVNSDDNGHGTLVAGILGATANNNLGIVGTNWQISLMPIKALDATGKGDAASIAEAIVWAADHGANIINLSVGGIGFAHDLALVNSINYAFKKNVVIVAAAGNDATNEGSNLDQEPVYPVCDDNNQNMIIGVTAVDVNDIKPAFANYGKNCIDVAAPGKRILSTINYDPLTNTYTPNSYVYASGTSLAVPFVSGQAALIKALYPNATNLQIRDNILSSADPIDNLNLSQCNGASCRGFLGTGRINAEKSLENFNTIQSVQEGDLIKLDGSPQIYQIQGGKRRPISSFVMNQRFLGLPIKVVTPEQLILTPEGPYLTPLENTLVKLANDDAVYIISNGQKLPLTLQIFELRKMDFASVQTVSYPEFDSWVTGPFLPPIDGSVVRGIKQTTVYWVINQVLHPVNYKFYIDKGLNVFSLAYLNDNDLNKFPIGDSFVR